MKPQPQRGHNADANTDAAVVGFLRLGVKENREEAHEAEPAKVSLPGERGEEPKAQSEPEQGAAAEGKEAGYEGEEKEGGDVGAGDAGPPDGESREAKAEVEAEAGASGGEGGEKGGEEQRPGAAVEVRKAADRRHRVSRHTFTLEQLRELEAVFRRTPYLNVAMQQELARRMGVTEDRMQVWFNHRRAKWRKYQRALRFRDAPPLLPAHRVVSNRGGPCNTVLIQELNCVWVLLEPITLELMPLPPVPPVPPLMLPVPPLMPMLPLPPLFLPPLPWILPPSIHSSCPHGLAWSPTTSGLSVAPFPLEWSP